MLACSFCQFSRIIELLKLVLCDQDLSPKRRTALFYNFYLDELFILRIRYATNGRIEWSSCYNWLHLGSIWYFVLLQSELWIAGVVIRCYISMIEIAGKIIDGWNHHVFMKKTQYFKPWDDGVGRGFCRLVCWCKKTIMTWAD